MSNEIYNFLKQNNLTQKDEATFLKEYSTPEKVNELYGFMQQNNLTQKSAEEFAATYFPAPAQKKSPSEATVTGSQTPAQQPLQPSNKNGAGYQWSNAQQPTEELATGGVQGEGTNLNQFLPLETSKKIGTKKVGAYLFDKNMELINSANEIETANTIQSYLNQSNNYQMYVAKKAEYDQAVASNDAAAQERIMGEINNIMAFPLVLTSPQQDGGIIKPTDEKLYNIVPPELKAAKTVGDAVNIQNGLQGRKDNAISKIEQAKYDINEIAAPLRSAIGFDLEESGYNEYGVGDAFMRGVMHTVDAVGTTLQLMGAKDDEQLNSMLKEKLGTQNILFPSKATEKYNFNVPVIGEINPVASTETGAGLLPYFASGGFGTVGGAVANTIMMGATGYSQGALRGYDEAMRQTNGNEAAALQAAKNMSIGSGLTGAATGGIGLPAFGVAGNILGSKAAGVAVTEGGIGELTIPQYLKYTLPKNAISNLPFALQTYADNKIAQAQGISRPSLEGVGESLTAAIFIGNMIDGLHYGAAKLSPKVRTTYETALAKFGFPQTLQAVNKQVADGVITKSEADKILKPIEDKAAALSKIDPDLSIETEVKVLPIVEDIAKLEAQKEKTDPAFHSKIDAELEKKRMQVAEETGAALTEKERKEYEKIVEKKNAPVGEGKEKAELLPSEKEKLEHYEKRIKQAGKNEANKIAQEQGFDSATHLLNSIKKAGLGEFDKVQDVPKEVLENLKTIKSEQDATKEIEQQPSVQAERESGSEVGQAGETGSSDSLQRETAGTEKRQVTDGETTETGVRPDETTATTETTAIEPTGETATQETTVLREGEKPVTEEIAVETIKPEVKDSFAKITDLFYKIREATGSSKKRSLKEQRDKILEENPSIKYIDDNISAVMKQLEDKGLITKKGDCP